jgi:hypothetical protein
MKQTHRVLRDYSYRTMPHNGMQRTALRAAGDAERWRRSRGSKD